jgi:hypothetical protein
MKQKFYFLLSFFWISLISLGQTTTLSYNDDVYTSGFPSVTLNNFTSCQVSASVTTSSQGYSGVWADRNYNVVVNGTNIGTYTGTQTIDISSYIPITSVQMNGLYSNWSWVDLTVNITSNNASMPATGPTVNNVTYVQGDTASPLSATLSGTGASLKWYTDQFGDNYSATGFTPSTATIGTTSYFVAQADASGCESLRSEIVVTVVPNTPATHLNFDGVNDVVNLGTTTSSLLNNSNFLTVEAWIKVPNVVGTKTIVGNHVGWGGTQFNLRVINNTLNAFLGDGYYGVSSAAGTITANTWTHVSMVYDDTTLKIYINGVEAGSTSVPSGYSLANTSPQTFIGNSVFGGEIFGGDIDEVRIWNTVKTIEQLNGSKNCELQGTEPGLLAYYKFNQGIDLANNSAVTTLNATIGPNGTLTNFALIGATSNWLLASPVTTGSIVPSVATVTTPVVYNQGDTASALTATTGANGTGLMWYTTASGGTGSATAPTPSTASFGNTSYWVSSTNANGCESARVEIMVTVIANATHLNFDGVNDFVVSTNAITNNTENQTYQAWFRIPSIPANNDRILQRGNDGTGGWSLQIDVNAAGRLSAGISATPDTFITGTTVLTPNTWYQATFVFENNNSLRLYLNGNLEASIAIGNRTLRNSDNRLRIGVGNLASEHFNGDIDEVRVWNKVLNATDILNTMNCELQATETGLVAYYKFNQGNDSVNNSTVTSLLDSSGNANNGTLTNFALTGTASNWKSGSAIITGNTCATLGNSDFDNETRITIYPNPSTRIFNIVSQQNISVEIYDLLGKLVYNQSLANGTNSIDISNFNTGVYLLKVTDDNGKSESHKLIKN